MLFRARSDGHIIVWIDETNFDLYCRRRENCSRASIVLCASKGANLHCTGAMTYIAVVLFTTPRETLLQVTRLFAVDARVDIPMLCLA